MAYELKHHTIKTVEKGKSFPLGAALTAGGVNFAVYSKHAAEVFLLLFDTPDGEPSDIIQIKDRDRFIWHARVNAGRPARLTGTKCAGNPAPRGGWGSIN